MFLNFSNHASANWSDQQKNAAIALGGEIVDVPFPQVSATADEAEIRALAERCADQLCAQHPDAVMCQGEFGLTYSVVTLLKARGVRTVYSCAERNTAERKTENGTLKTVEFCFVRCRDY